MGGEEGEGGVTGLRKRGSFKTTRLRANFGHCWRILIGVGHPSGRYAAAAFGRSITRARVLALTVEIRKVFTYIYI